MLMGLSFILQVSGHKYLDKLKSSPDDGARGNHKCQPHVAAKWKVSHQMNIELTPGIMDVCAKYHGNPLNS